MQTDTLQTDTLGIGDSLFGKQEAAAASRGDPALPTQRRLDQRLRAQRLRLIWMYSLGLSVFSWLWCAGSVAYGLVISHSGWLTVFMASHASILAVGACIALVFCRYRSLRAATYTNVAALLVVGAIHLACLDNAEAAGVIIYCVAVSVAALVLEGREWLRVGAIISATALVGGLLHWFPVIQPFHMPELLENVATLMAVTLGLAYPMGMLWLFSSNLTASQAEAWRLARSATEANQLLTERSREVEVRSEQLEAKNLELSDFLYVVSHDLRAPLINLEGFSRALQDNLSTLDGLMQMCDGNGAGIRAAQQAWPPLRAEITEALDFILRSVAKMDFLVKGLLELSRIDTRPNQPQAVELNAIVGDILGAMQYNINARGIEVTVEPLPTVVGDAVRLSQLFSNLIDNAIKYMKPRGEARIHIGCQECDDGYRFFVRDTGLGIRAEDHAKIFRLFTRLCNSGVPGEGIGLTAVKKIVEKHKGRIWVESELGQGSTFWFTLPRSGGKEGTGHDARKQAAH